MNATGYCSAIAEHRRHIKGLKRMASGTESPCDLLKLSRQLKWCGSCREEFDRLVRVERILSQNFGIEHNGLTPLERRVGCHAVLAQLGVTRPWRSWIPRWKIVGGLSLAAALALLFVLVFPTSPRKRPSPGHQLHKEEEMFMSRGSLTPPSVRLFCVDLRAAPSKRFRPAREPNSKVATCRISDQLKIAYLNSHPANKYLWVFALDNQSHIKWYYPTPKTVPGVLMTAKDSWTSLPDMVRLEVNHQPGRFKVVALFSSHPLQPQIIQAAVERLRKRRVQNPREYKLPLSPHIKQTTFDLIIEP